VDLRRRGIRCRRRRPLSRSDSYPAYTPDQAGLVVDFVRGRWIAGWRRLEEANSDLPESRRESLVRIQAAPEAPYGVAFYEV
jgi:hypothetical protein